MYAIAFCLQRKEVFFLKKSGITLFRFGGSEDQMHTANSFFILFTLKTHGKQSKVAKHIN
jgi:hypothetical protein